MKKLLLIFLCLLSLVSIAQQAPEKGDYLMVSYPKGERGNYIFKKSNKVHYGYVFSTKKTDNKYKQDAGMVKGLFHLADSLGIEKIKSLDESSLNLEEPNHEYKILEYRKGPTLFRICWDAIIDDENAKKLNAVAYEMTVFW